MVEHDLESFLWVILYAVYKHALNELKPRTEFRQHLLKEFCGIFAARDAEDLIRRRGRALGDDPTTGEDAVLGINRLYEYATDFVNSVDLPLFLQSIVWPHLQIMFQALKKSKKKSVHPLRAQTYDLWNPKLKNQAHVIPTVPSLTHDALITPLQLLIEGEKEARCN